MPKMASGGPCSTFSHREEDGAAAAVGADAGDASSILAENARVLVALLLLEFDEEKESAAPAESAIHNSSANVVDVKSFMTGDDSFLHLAFVQVSRQRKMRSIHREE